MKIISTVMLALGAGAALMSASVSPIATAIEKKEVTTQAVQAVQSQEVGGAIRVIAPQKDLETAIRNSEKGDILLFGTDGWYRIEGKALQQGTKMYVLGGQDSMISVFPKETDRSAR